MLALILACSISAGGVRAQFNHEYDFQKRTVTDAQSFDNTGDPIPVLSMDCLSANGFGQWTLSHFAGTGSFNGLGGSTEFPAGWYLLANDLEVGDVNGSPPGVVQSGELLDDAGNPITTAEDIPSETEVTANLDSWVNYIWPDPNLGEQFVVNFFEPSDFEDASGDMLSANFCVDPTIGNFGTTGSMRVIPQGSSLTTTIHQTAISMGGHDVAVIASGPYQDLYDRTSDAHYVYIAWMDNNGEIWASVQVHGANPPAEVPPFSVGFGTIPTVACDQRDNRTSPFSPNFDVAFINTSGHPVDFTFTGDSHISTPRLTSPNFTTPCGVTGAFITSVTHARAMVSEISGGTDVHGLYVIGQSSTDPTGEEALFLYTDLPSIGTPQSPVYCDGPLLVVTHIPTDAGTLADNGIIDEPINAICDPYDNQNNNANAWDCFHCVYRMNALFVDGSTSNNVIAMLSMKSTHNGGCGDGSLSDDTRTPFTDPFQPATSPDPGYVAAVNQMGIHVHWRSGLSGSGAHTYARDFNRHFDEPIEENTIVTSGCRVTDGTLHGGTAGATLVNGKNMLIWTDPNYGADAAIPGGLQFGTYQPSGGALGVFPVVGNIWLLGAVKLNVGDGTNPSMLTVMPNFYILFEPESQVDGESVTVNPGSTLNYYGLWQDLQENPGGHESFVFGAAQMTTNPGVRAGEGLIDLEGATNGSNNANLIVHGGADFHIGYNGYFTSNFGTIDILNEDNIFPLLTSGNNGPANGLLTFEGQATLNNTKVQAHTGPFNSGINAGFTAWNSTTSTISPNSYVYTVIHVPGSYDGGLVGTPFYTESRTGYARPNGAFTSTNTSYTDYDPGESDIENEDPLGLAVIQFDQNPTADLTGFMDGGFNLAYGEYNYYPYLHVSSDNDVFLNFSIEAVDPQVTDADPEISITNGNFELKADGYNSALHSSLSQDYIKFLKVNNTPFEPPPFDWTKYGYIYLNGNFFYTRSNDANTSSSDLDVIGFETEQPSSWDNTDVLAKLALIDIDGNYFYEDGSGVFNGTTFGINLNESNSMTQNNSILSSFTNGISISGDPVNGINNFSYLCTNTIGSAAVGGPSVGILTSDYEGYINSNQIQYAILGLQNTGQLSNNTLNDVPHLVGTTIYNCYSYGIEVDAGEVDLSGLHHNVNLPGTGDWFGLNSIFSNCYNSSMSNPAQINASTNNANVWVTQNGLSTWTQAGNNNIYRGNSSSSVLILGSNDLFNDVDISTNYWGSGIDPQSSSPSFWPNYVFGAVNPAVSQSTSDWTCGSGDDIAAKPKKEQMKIMSEDTDTCSVKFPIFVSGLISDDQYRQGYDTMRYWYIPHCYQIANAGATAGALSGSANPTVLTTMDSLLDYRSFIIHCLTLRNDDDWFCSFVANLVGTFRDSNSIINGNYRDARGVIQYLMDNPRCDSSYSQDSTVYWQLLIGQYQIWKDTAHGNAQFDSTVPTMQELGLDSVLIINGEAGVTYAVPTPAIINSASVLENPFQNSTSILLSVGRESYITIAVYNVLGQQIAGAGYAGVFEQGSATVPINMSNAPPGTYLVRISTANNEVQTLKLTKQ